MDVLQKRRGLSKSQSAGAASNRAVKNAHLCSDTQPWCNCEAWIFCFLHYLDKSIGTHLPILWSTWCMSLYGHRYHRMDSKVTDTADSSERSVDYQCGTHGGTSVWGAGGQRAERRAWECFWLLHNTDSDHGKWRSPLFGQSLRISGADWELRGGLERQSKANSMVQDQEMRLWEEKRWASVLLCLSPSTSADSPNQLSWDTTSAS